jgi:hypothetical protein
VARTLAPGVRGSPYYCNGKDGETLISDSKSFFPRRDRSQCPVQLGRRGSIAARQASTQPEGYIYKTGQPASRQKEGQEGGIPIG